MGVVSNSTYVPVDQIEAEALAERLWVEIAACTRHNDSTRARRLRDVHRHLQTHAEIERVVLEQLTGRSDQAATVTG